MIHPCANCGFERVAHDPKFAQANGRDTDPNRGFTKNLFDCVAGQGFEEMTQSGASRQVQPDSRRWQRSPPQMS